MDKEKIIEEYNERVAICMFDGKLPEEAAKKIARDQIIEYYGEEVKHVFE